MKVKTAYLVVLVFVLSIIVQAADRAILVHNTRQDIAAVKDKLKLKLVRVWGGDEEEDEHKFFKSPISIAIDAQGTVYICNMYNHNIKVFDRSGKYVRTIGQKGQGPGDLYQPTNLTITPNGYLVVSELGNRRVQYFEQKGKSINILKLGEWVRWMGFDSKNQLLAYLFYETYKSRKLLYIFDDKGESVGTFGTYQDNADDVWLSGRRRFALDSASNIYVANVNAPVIRKFDPEGNLLMSVTFEPPFDIPVKVALNDQGTDIEIIGRWPERKYKKVRKGKSVSVQATGKSSKVALCQHLVSDSKNRIYIMSTTMRRVRSKEEMKNGLTIIGTRDYFKVLNKDKIASYNFDARRLLVFSPKGKIIGDSALNKFADSLFIFGNRLFVADAYINQRILEYEISIDESAPEVNFGL